MDDVILFGRGTLEEWNAYKAVLDLFCSTYGMSISMEKSSFLRNNLMDKVYNSISAILPFKMDPINQGFKYLVFRPKPLGYVIKDQRWILKIFENKLGH